MKPITKLNLGYNDAINYKRRENKEFFSKIFIKDAQLNRLCSRDIFFLIGEKGTGKTAYATYIENISPDEIRSKIMMLGETEYQKFITLKHENGLKLSDYSDVWQATILLLFAEFIKEQAKSRFSITKYVKFAKLERAISEYYSNAFTPEILQALKFFEKTSATAKLVSKHLSGGFSESEEVKFEEARYNNNLMYITARFKECLSDLRLENDFVLFFDGIDMRPQSISYEDYIECVKGLADATWKLNNGFFPGIKDTKGRMRCVMLLRPDIFLALELQNQNTKMRDNSVILDWRTEDAHYRQSFIFSVADRILAANQEVNTFDGQSWDNYFPFDARNVRLQKLDSLHTSFLTFLRLSFHRPRDIVTLMRALQDHYKRSRKEDATKFSVEDFSEASVRRDYGEYVLNEIRDQMLFYYGQADFTVLKGFFAFLKGKAKFTYDEFSEAVLVYKSSVQSQGLEEPKFLKTVEGFLQFLYDVNIICYYEDASDESFLRWCFREKEATDLSPRVMLYTTYRIHDALLKTLNVGKSFGEARPANARAPSPRREEHSSVRRSTKNSQKDRSAKNVPLTDVPTVNRTRAENSKAQRAVLIHTAGIGAEKNGSSGARGQFNTKIINPGVVREPKTASEESGMVSMINKAKAIGFILNGNGEEIFFRAKDCVDWRSIRKGNAVSFTVKLSENGKKRAIKISARDS